MGLVEKEVAGRCGGDVLMGAPTHPVGQTVVGCESGGSSARVFSHDESRVHRSVKNPSGR